MNVTFVDLTSMRYRVVPFIVGGKQHYTLVQEWLENGKVVRDSRQQMTKAQFLQLKQAVNEGDDYEA